MRAEESAVLSRELETARETLRRTDARNQSLHEAAIRARALGQQLDECFPPNHHLRINHHILNLCLLDEISQVNSARLHQRRRIEDLADQLTDEGIPV